MQFQGICIAVFAGLLVPIIAKTLNYDDQIVKTQVCLLVMIAFAVGAIFGSLIMGFLVDRIGSKKCVFMNLILLVTSIALTITVLNVN